MPVVSAFLVPGSPLPVLKPESLGWGRLASAMQRAGRALEASKPDTVLLYSTQWMAVLDQLWLTRKRSQGLHVDENWYEFGDLPYDIHADTELAHACVAASPRRGVHARGVNYDGFPIDTGTIVACTLLGIGGADRPLVVGSNNLYHSGQVTEELGSLAKAAADEQGKRVAVVGVGGLSGSLFRTEINPRNDRIASPEDDRWNQRILQFIQSGDVAQLRSAIPQFAAEARADMGFKHFHWILGALSGRFTGARVHGYGPVYGSGAAVVEFTL
jgi:2-aminophenol/2-amino-5-chlorophenol 1,6-dioxygenase alpha subunit